MKRNPAFGGATKLNFCAINDFGCAPKHLVVLHRGEMKRNPGKNDVLCSLVNSSEIGAMRMI